MRAFAKVAKTLGYSFIVNVSHVYPGQFQQLLEEAQGADNFDVLSAYMLAQHGESPL